MLYDLFNALFEAFRWIVIGIAAMAGIGLVFVGIPAAVGWRRHVRYVNSKEKLRFDKALEAQVATFYDNDKNDFFDNRFFERIQQHVFNNDSPDTSIPVSEPEIDTSIDAVLRDEAMRFFSGEYPIVDQSPTLFEEQIGRRIHELPMNLSADPFPKLLRSVGMDAFLKNTDGDTDGFPELS